MFYEFPVINHIDDVLPAIQGCDQFIIKKAEDYEGGYTTINYVVQLGETFPEPNTLEARIRRECRGIKFCNHTGKIIVRPYHKFFNLGEKEFKHSRLPEEPYQVIEKLDGSMVTPIPMRDGSFRLGTKMGITDVSRWAEAHIQGKKNYTKFIKLCVPEITPIFEWCSRKQRIVIDYPEDQLILTAMRWNDTGEYMEYETLVEYGEDYDIPVVKLCNHLPIDYLSELVRGFTDSEGVVARYTNGHMFKIKAEQYMQLHRTKDLLRWEKDVIDIIISHKLDDLIPLLPPHDVARIEDYSKAFWSHFNTTVDKLWSVYVDGFSRSGGDKRTFAIDIAKDMTPEIRSVCFAIWNKTKIDLRDSLLTTIKKNVSSSTRVDSVRWIFGNIRLNEELTNE